MSLAKRTYSLPVKTLASFEESVPSGERSALVAGLLSDWLVKQHREKLRREIVKGCQDMASLYLEIEKEYHPLEEEVHRALEFEPTPRGRRSRKA